MPIHPAIHGPTIFGDFNLLHLMDHDTKLLSALAIIKVIQARQHLLQSFSFSFVFFLFLQLYNVLRTIPKAISSPVMISSTDIVVCFITSSGVFPPLISSIWVSEIYPVVPVVGPLYGGINPRLSTFKLLPRNAYKFHPPCSAMGSRLIHLPSAGW